MEILQAGQLLTTAAGWVLPPAFGVIAALWIFRFINRAVFARLEASGKRALLYHHRLRNARETLELYGLGWIVPFSLILVFVALVFAGHGILAATAGKIPPYVKVDDAYLIPPTIDRDDRLLLVRKYPGADDYEMAYDLSVKAWDLAGKKSVANNSDIYDRLARMAKYLALVAAVAWLWGLGSKAARWTASARLLAVLVGCVALWGLGAAGYVKEKEKGYQGTWREIRNTLRVEGYRQEVARPTAAEREKMQDGKPKPWWWISSKDD
jgi:hypothetical protein